MRRSDLARAIVATLVLEVLLILLFAGWHP